MLEHLGEKLILHVSLGSFSFSFDILTVIMSWIVIIVLVVVALILRRGLGQDIEEKCNLSASLGYAYFSKGMDMKTFVETADKQLYKVKKQKNNKKK